MKKIIYILIIASLFSCKKSEHEIAKDSLLQINWKSDSIKYFKLVEYVVTEKPRCNAFRDIYAFKVRIKDTLGMDLENLSKFLLENNRQLELSDCSFPNHRDVFVYKNLKDAKKQDGNWIIMNSYSVGFSYLEFNNKQYEKIILATIISCSLFSCSDSDDSKTNIDRNIVITDIGFEYN